MLIILAKGITFGNTLILSFFSPLFAGVRQCRAWDRFRARSAHCLQYIFLQLHIFKKWWYSYKIFGSVLDYGVKFIQNKPNTYKNCMFNDIYMGKKVVSNINFLWQ